MKKLKFIGIGFLMFTVMTSCSDSEVNAEAERIAAENVRRDSLLVDSVFKYFEKQISDTIRYYQDKLDSIQLINEGLKITNEDLNNVIRQQNTIIKKYANK